MEWQTQAITHQLANQGRSKKHAEAMHAVADSYRISAGRQPERPSEPESWTPDTPVNYDDPKFNRNSTGTLLSLATRIEQRRD